jgi:hypothetical protein
MLHRKLYMTSLNRHSAGSALATLTRDLGESAIPGPLSGLSQVGRPIRYRRSDIEAYEQAGFVSREPARTASSGDPSDAREIVERLIRTLGS